MSTVRLFTILCLIAINTVSTQAQITQTLKGSVIDTDSEMPLIGASIEVVSVEPTVGTSTDIDGLWRIENVSVGRHLVKVSYLGYKTITLPNVIVNAGKETNLTISLEEDFNRLNEVVITAETDKDRAINEMAAVSAKTFSLEEVTRYSGGRNDVSRLVSNFAGVSTADDSRNDIVIRGTE